MLVEISLFHVFTIAKSVILKVGMLLAMKMTREWWRFHLTSFCPKWIQCKLGKQEEKDIQITHLTLSNMSFNSSYS